MSLNSSMILPSTITEGVIDKLYPLNSSHPSLMRTSTYLMEISSLGIMRVECTLQNSIIPTTIEIIAIFQVGSGIFILK